MDYIGVSFGGQEERIRDIRLKPSGSLYMIDKVGGEAAPPS